MNKKFISMISLFLIIIFLLICFYCVYGNLSIVLPFQNKSNELIDENISVIGEDYEPFIDYDFETQKLIKYSVEVKNKSKYTIYPIKQKVDLKNCFYEKGFDGVSDVTLNPNETITTYNYIVCDMNADDEEINKIINESGNHHIIFKINYMNYEVIV